MSIYKLGIDVSAIQKVNWSDIKKPIPLFGTPRSVKYVTIKVSEGGAPGYPGGVNDSKSLSHAQGAISQHLPKGYYHFARFHKKDHDAEDQATRYGTRLMSLPPADLHLVKTVDVHGSPVTLPDHWLDVETNDEALTPTEFERWIHLYMEKFLSYGPNSIGIYGGARLNEFLPKGHSLGKYPLWLGEYGKENQLIIPRGWDSWIGWQFTGKGIHPAIIGNVDMDFVR